MPASDWLSEFPPCDRRSSRRAFGRGLTAAAITAMGLGHRSLRAQAPAPSPLRVMVWCEGCAPKQVYPDDVDGAIATDLKKRPGIQVATARLDQPDAGLSDAALDATDVLIYWGRLRHGDVPDARAQAIAQRVKQGRLGLVALHASCASKPFQALMGMACGPEGWREDGSPEHVAIESPNHPLARGVEPFTIPQSAAFAEPFAVPTPETVVLVSRWNSGATFRSGLTWTIDQGRVVYFRPGHDAFPVLFHPSVRQVIANAATWAGKRV